MADDNWIEEARRLHREIDNIAEVARRVGKSKQLVHYHLTGAKRKRRRERQTPEQAEKARRYARNWHRRKKAREEDA